MLTLTYVGANYIGKTLFLTTEPALCFLCGTHIATPLGEAVAEEFRVGDLVRTAGGANRPIRSIEALSYSAPFASRRVVPVLFPAGSLGDGLPRRNLYVSPEHALFFDGLLIPASDLCDGVIRQVRVGETIDYVQLELDEHDVLLAEGVPTESFLGDRSRLPSANGALPAGRAEPATGCCAPRVMQGFALEAIRRRISASRATNRLKATT